MIFIVSEYVLWVLLLYRLELIQVLRQGIGGLSVEFCKKSMMMITPMTCSGTGMLSGWRHDSYIKLPYCACCCLTTDKNFFLSHQ